MGLFLQDALVDENRQVTISGALSIEGPLGGDVTFQGTTSWSMEMSGLEKTVSGALNAASSWANHFGKEYTQQKLQTFMSMEVDWVSSNPMTFSVPILIMSTGQDMDRASIGAAMGATAPSKIQSVGKGIVRRVDAPLGYQKRAEGGKVAVRIGNWFKTGKDFVVESTTVTASRDLDKAGIPLFYNLSVTLKPARTLDAETVSQYFT